jgi:hypothetical protein
MGLAKEAFIEGVNNLAIFYVTSESLPRYFSITEAPYVKISIYFGLSFSLVHMGTRRTVVGVGVGERQKCICSSFNNKVFEVEFLNIF